jgi:hypothetical protein
VPTTYRLFVNDTAGRTMRSTKGSFNIFWILTLIVCGLIRQVFASSNGANDCSPGNQSVVAMNYHTSHGGELSAWEATVVIDGLKLTLDQRFAISTNQDIHIAVQATSEGNARKSFRGLLVRLIPINPYVYTLNFLSR